MSAATPAPPPSTGSSNPVAVFEQNLVFIKQYEGVDPGSIDDKTKEKLEVSKKVVEYAKTTNKEFAEYETQFFGTGQVDALLKQKLAGTQINWTMIPEIRDGNSPLLPTPTDVSFGKAKPTQGNPIFDSPLAALRFILIDIAKANRLNNYQQNKNVVTMMNLTMELCRAEIKQIKRETKAAVMEIAIDMAKAAAAIVISVAGAALTMGMAGLKGFRAAQANKAQNTAAANAKSASSTTVSSEKGGTGLGGAPANSTGATGLGGATAAGKPNTPLSSATTATPEAPVSNQAPAPGSATSNVGKAPDATPDATAASAEVPKPTGLTDRQAFAKGMQGGANQAAAINMSITTVSGQITTLLGGGAQIMVKLEQGDIKVNMAIIEMTKKMIDSAMRSFEDQARRASKDNDDIYKMYNDLGKEFLRGNSSWRG